MNSKLLLCVVTAAALLAPRAVLASAAEEAQSLMNQGQYAEALKKLDAHLSKNPQDAEARFTRGLALVKLSRSDDAVKVFADLTRDYPQLPEPYNNLAVLYAQQGDYEKARDALEAALATHPSYATAHENLGDIYAALAGAAYNRALMLDQGNQIVRNKLNLISQLDHVPATAVSAAKAAPVAPVMSKPAPAVVAAAPTPTAAVPAPAPKPVPSKVEGPVPAKLEAPATVAPAPVAAAPPVAAMPAPAAAPAGAALTDNVNSLLLSWTKAWSSQDLNAYFAAYADEFTPEGGLTRTSWQGQRRDRISRPKRITVRAVNPQIVQVGVDRANVTFQQEYESDSFSDTVTKVLELKLSGGNWKITREYTR